MMQLRDVEYPLRLCVEMLHYCAIFNELTKDKSSSEVKEMLKAFFTDEQIEESFKLLCGSTDKVNDYGSRGE